MSDQDDSFSLRRDFKNIHWPSTMKYNLLRASGAGIVWLVLALLTGQGWHAFTMLFFPVVFLVFFLPIGLFAAWLSSLGIPWVGLVAALIAVFVAVGDPLVFVLKKARPELVPAEKVKFFNLQTVIFILSPPPGESAPAAEGQRKELTAGMFRKD
jgi:peptidoglycan/LPS O-acetylase OafA/YrhL